MYLIDAIVYRYNENDRICNISHNNTYHNNIYHTNIYLTAECDIFIVFIT